MRRVFALGLAVFGAGGLVCAAAPTLAVVVLGRAAQGIGGRPSRRIPTDPDGSCQIVRMIKQDRQLNGPSGRAVK